MNKEKALKNQGLEFREDIFKLGVKFIPDCLRQWNFGLHVSGLCEQ